MRRAIVKPLSAVGGADWFRELLVGDELPASVDHGETIAACTCRMVDMDSEVVASLACTPDDTASTFTIAGQQPGHDYWVVVQFTTPAGKKGSGVAYISCPDIPLTTPA